MSGYPIVWSPRAASEFIEILEFLELNFDAGIAAECVILVESITEKISLFPKMYPAFGPSHVRKAVVQKHLTLFYRFQHGQIDILKAWDNRQNPDDLRL